MGIMADRWACPAWAVFLGAWKWNTLLSFKISKQRTHVRNNEDLYSRYKWPRRNSVFTLQMAS